MNLVKIDGFYKAIVVDNHDPAGLNRVKIRIPSLDGSCSEDNNMNNLSQPRMIRVSDDSLLWAEVCHPYHDLSLPNVNQVVLVGFFGGYSDTPVVLGWMGYDYEIEKKFNPYNPITGWSGDLYAI